MFTVSADVYQAHDGDLRVVVDETNVYRRLANGDPIPESILRKLPRLSRRILFLRQRPQQIRLRLLCTRTVQLRRWKNRTD